MRILRMEVLPRTMALHKPYTIAYETVSSVTNVFVRIVTDTRHVGLGEAAPTPSVTGESPEACLAGLEAVAHAIVGEDALARMRVLGALDEVLGELPAARAAIDGALWDLLGKACGQPVHRLLGGFRQEIRTSITLGIDDPAAMVAEARDAYARGFRALKLKGGLDPARDAEVVRRVREALGAGVRLRFDANQGYDEAGAACFLAGVEGADLEVLEQPTPRGRWDLLGGVTRRAAMPVMADESVLDLHDALVLARRELVDTLNIKLQKVGGLEAAIAVNAVGLAAGYEVMVGCMDESSLAVAAGLHFALARPNVAYADLDGHMDLVEDPAAGAVRLEAGVLRPAPGPGFGVVDLPT